ncbi:MULTISPECIES: hypothetical protein [unclassified Nodularia (in: cyanobacteria)]|uniref:hypothetical protein n=1 Tax=unclassified Nodularia (in: cyanobacteria) TaxID=2656917 RepID=UPI00187EFFAB|nr:MULTISPECIES: hypothetical protein [unclassified Nodularia (in: cyanobacteria)]MBE9202046.1 hypothetical protein [Nodularia sp. LEGE 06071]MCC2694500.1 hypothetical protein [Nodularia sp. LEGE 04288]
MQEIEQFNHQLKAQRRTATFLSTALFIGGVSLCLPLFADTTKYPETLFCFNPDTDVCEGHQIKRGITWIIDRERRNFTFDNKVKFLRVIPPEAPKAPLYGVLGTVLLIGAYGVSKSLTDTQEKAIHSQFSLLKIKALENDIYVSNHLDLTAYSKQHQAQITKEIIARDTAGAIEQLKSEGEQQLDHINGQLQGEVALKSHELQISELDKAIADNRLSTVETTRKIEKISKPITDSKTDTQSPNEALKTSLIDALKGHEDGYLWKIINSLKPLWLIGNQGSGKTYTAGAIALIRKYCLDAPVHQLIDRHATGDNAEVWKLLQAYTLAETEEDISTAFDECCDRWLQRIKQKPKTKQQVICDEFTNLKSLCGDSAIAFFKMSLTDTRKAKEYLLGITHNATNESFPDGTASARKAGTILLEKFSANGETPLSRVVVRYGLVDENGNNLEDEERTLPTWMHPERIYQHFNGKPINFED